ncbi:uncharacterized protein LOC141819224 [Curcuma longa]|uniref:uncharacterized protein LOC141819224 n=1 Tax=Curcuma longa TaxID=136217 RepID=UPI003D9F54B8
MGNCQASEAAVVVIQHPGGKVERLYWPTTAADVMRSNPGYYVALVTLYVSEEKDGGAAVRFTRARLLKAKDMLLLGQVYRLIASHEITKAVRQRKHEMLKKSQEELIRKQQREQKHRKTEKGIEAAQEEEQQEEDSENSLQVARQDRDRQKSRAQMVVRGRHWRPSLRSISETVS